MTIGVVHLICGPTGGGKTTYAAKLAREAGAVRFSVDEWMTALFWMDSPQPIDSSWAMERVERCSALIWSTAEAICRQGVPVALELGLVNAEIRGRYVDKARRAGLPVRLHVVDAPVEERWKRVEARNLAPGDAAQLNFALTREMFDFVEGMWEPPTDEELAGAHGVRIGSAFD